MKELKFKDYLSLTEDQIFDLSLHYSKKDKEIAVKVADSLFNIYTATEPILEQVSLERLFQTEEQNRFVSFCPVGTKDGSGKVRLTSEFFRNPKTKQIINNQNRTQLKDIIKDLASWELKLKTAGVDSRINLGIMPGWADAAKSKYLFFLDLDNKGSFQGNIQKIIESIGIKTFIVSTPSGGAHLYFFSTKEESNSPLCGNADIRAKTYCLAPGSQTKKGFYLQDIENPFFQKEIATVPSNWRELFIERINNSISIDQPSHPSSLSYSIGLPPAKSSKLLGSDKAMFLEMFETGIVPEGSRNSYLFWTASYIVGKNKTHGFDHCLSLLINERDRVKIDSKEFNESVLAKMINYLIDKEQKKKNIDKPSESLGFAKNIDLSGLYTKQLIEKLSTFSKTEEYEMKIEKIASTVQRYFEVRFGREYSKPILTKAVGEFLTSAGFSKKQRRMQSGRSMVWNISEASLVELEAFIDSFIPTEAAVVQEQSVVPVVFEECPQEFLEIPTEPSFKSVGTTNKAINSGLCKPFKLLSEVELESFFESVDMNILLIKKEFKPINL